MEQPDSASLIVDHLKYCDIRNLLRVNTTINTILRENETRRMREKAEAVEALMKPPFELTYEQLCNKEEFKVRPTQFGTKWFEIFLGAIANGALANLNTLFLISDDQNKMGDDGMKAFSEACGMGALPNLKKLYLTGHNIGDGGMIAFSKACKEKALANLEELFLSFNQIGDGGMEAFSNACARGGLKNLTDLNLYHNNIGDKGINALSKACEETAFAKLTSLVIGSNQFSDPSLLSLARTIKKGGMARLEVLSVVARVGDDARSVDWPIINLGRYKPEHYIQRAKIETTRYVKVIISWNT